MAELMSLKWLLHSAASAVKPTAITHVNTWVKVNVQHIDQSLLVLFGEKKKWRWRDFGTNQPRRTCRRRRGSRQPQESLVMLEEVVCSISRGSRTIIIIPLHHWNHTRNWKKCRWDMVVSGDARFFATVCHLPGIKVKEINKSQIFTNSTNTENRINKVLFSSTLSVGRYVPLCT